MCGASSEQKDMYAKQSAFYDTMTASYKAAFGKSQAILDTLIKTYQPILDKGPNQYGFSDAEDTTLRSGAKDTVARNYGQASKALGENLAAEGGGDAYLPSGQDAVVKGELAGSAAALESGEENQITLAGYDYGSRLFSEATNALDTAAGLENPVGFAGAANNAGSAAAQTADQIAAANNSWMGPVFGALGGIAGAAVGGFGGGGGAPKASGNPFPSGDPSICWVAAELYDGWEGRKTSLVRRWLVEEFAQGRVGGWLVAAYRRHGQRLAGWVRRSRLVRRLMHWPFDAALREAVKIYG